LRIKGQEKFNQEPSQKGVVIAGMTPLTINPVEILFLAGIILK
jgi:hypothetical protein